MVKEAEFLNNSPKRGTYHIKMLDSVSDTVTNSWNIGGTLSIGQEIEYGIEILGTGVKGKTSFSYGQAWGKSEEKSQSVTIGSEVGIDVELDPGESVMAMLSASITSTENIKIGYYGNAKVELRNPETRELKEVYLLSDNPGIE